MFLNNEVKRDIQPNEMWTSVIIQSFHSIPSFQTFVKNRDNAFLRFYVKGGLKLSLIFKKPFVKWCPSRIRPKDWIRHKGSVWRSLPFMFNEWLDYYHIYSNYVLFLLSHMIVLNMVRANVFFSSILNENLNLHCLNNNNYLLYCKWSCVEVYVIILNIYFLSLSIQVLVP